MFGKKESTKEEIQSVPVYTVPYVQRPHEPITTVQTVIIVKVNAPSNPYFDLIEKLGQIGAKHGADAVIDVRFHAPTHGLHGIYAFGTAIKYLDK